MSAADGRRRTARDERRRRLGQNFLLPDVAESFVAGGDFAPGELVMEIGPGRGACTDALVRRGVEVVAVERDPRWADVLRRTHDAGRTSAAARSMIHRKDDSRAGTVRVVEADARGVRFDRLARGRPYRVLGSLPFGATTALLRRLFDEPARGPWRADLIVQWEVARKRAVVPPTTLLSTTWAPWWHFELVRRIPATAFRPVPAVDAAVLCVTRRQPALLPTRLAGDFGTFVRERWE